MFEGGFEDRWDGLVGHEIAGSLDGGGVAGGLDQDTRWEESVSGAADLGAHAEDVELGVGGGRGFFGGVNLEPQAPLRKGDGTWLKSWASIWEQPIQWPL